MLIWRNHCSSLFSTVLFAFWTVDWAPEVWPQLPGLQEPFATSISWATFGGRFLERGWGTEQLRASAEWLQPQTNGTTVTNHVAVLNRRAFMTLYVRYQLFRWYSLKSMATFAGRVSIHVDPMLLRFSTVQTDIMTSFLQFVRSDTGVCLTFFLTSCRSFSSGMSTPRWWATGEQWAHTLPNDLLGNLCTWARVVLLGDESRWLQMHGMFGSQFCQP